jgi:hypothetical protein
MDLQMVIVAAIERIEVHGAGAVQIPGVGGDRPVARADRRGVVAADHVDMGRHVPQMAGIGHEIAQDVGGPKHLFRPGRHLHQVQVHVQEAGVPPGRTV